MVPSIRRSVLACVLALVGLGLWQAYWATANSPNTKDKTLTVTDDGQELRCRIVKITVKDDGTRVYDLEVMDTGEKLSVEELPPSVNIGRDRKVHPLRIFRRSRGDEVVSKPAAASKPVENKSLPSPIVQTAHGVPSPVDSSDRAASAGKLRQLRQRQQQPAPQETLVEVGAPAENKERKRLPERLVNRVTSLFPEKKKAEDADSSEVPQMTTETAPVPEEQPASSPNTPLANRLSKMFPSGRPANKEQPGTLPATVTQTPVPETPVVEEPARASPRGPRAFVQSLTRGPAPTPKSTYQPVPVTPMPSPEMSAEMEGPARQLPRGPRAALQRFTNAAQPTSNKGLIPKLTGKSTYQPVPAAPVSDPVSVPHRSPPPVPSVQSRPKVPTQNQLTRTNVDERGPTLPRTVKPIPPAGMTKPQIQVGGQKLTEKFPALSSNAKGTNPPAKETHPVGVSKQPVVNAAIAAPTPVNLPPAIGDSKLELAGRPPEAPPLPPALPKQQPAVAKSANSVIFGQSPLAAMAAASGATPKKQAPVKHPSGENIPAGAGSVLAAKSGARTPVTFVPVPIVTVPDPMRRPGPPEPKIPEAPQANAYLNAFTPTQNNTRPQNQPMMAMVPANGAYVNPHLMQPGMVPTHPAYNQMPMQQPIQGVSAVNPYAAQRPVAQVNYPVHYQGPTPPNPMMQPRMAPAYYGQPMPMYPRPPVQLPVAPPAPQVEQLMSMLRDSPYPSQREWAAQTLAGCDVRSNPHIVNALAEAARKDPAGSVRAGCVHCLVRMTVPANEVMGTLTALQNDSDARVRDQVTQAMARMGHTPTTDRPAIQPVSQLPE